GLNWINTSALLNRYTFANIMASNRQIFTSQTGVYIPIFQLDQITSKTPKKIVKSLLSRLGPLNVGGATTRKLIDYLQKDDAGNVVGFQRNDDSLDKKVRGLIHLIMCLSEFQLS